MPMQRAEHFREYEQFTEIVPGVFVEPGEAVYIVDPQGEVVSWNCDEWAEDPTSVTATVNAVILATAKGAAAVRENIETQGRTINDLIDKTHRHIYEM